MKRYLILLGGILCWQTNSKAGQNTEEYIEQWKVTAVEQMREFSIPASITLAQGILESASGTSALAQTANNHFGIKCHVNWEGEKYYMDDDTRHECFRSYDAPVQSYDDHSIFLTSRSRYAELFDLKMTDYKGWARGLKNAGYATNPQYADLLIDIVERFGLNAYDKNIQIPEKNEKELSALPARNESGAEIIRPDHEVSDKKESTAASNHQVMKNKWDIRYITVKPGDTYYRIASEFGLGLWQLYRYNDLGQRDVLHEGEVIYLDPKKNKASKGYTVFICTRVTTLREISQQEGLKLKSLMKLNFMTDPDAKLREGEKIILR